MGRVGSRRSELVLSRVRYYNFKKRNNFPCSLAFHLAVRALLYVASFLSTSSLHDGTAGGPPEKIGTMLFRFTSCENHEDFLYEVLSLGHFATYSNVHRLRRPSTGSTDKYQGPKKKICP